MSSLSTMTVVQLAELSNAPVVHPTGQRKSKLIAIARMASMLALKEALAARGLKKKAERKSKNQASAKNTRSRVTRKNFTFRRLVTNTMIQKNGWPSNEGTRGGTRGKNGHFLRVAIHKETRKVSRSMKRTGRWKVTSCTRRSTRATPITSQNLSLRREN